MDLLTGLLLAGGVASAGILFAGLPAVHLPEVLAVYAGISLLILRGWVRSGGDDPAPRNSDPVRHGLGPANRVTLGRLVLALPAAALVLQPAALDAGTQWWVVGLGTLVLSLDGVDGWVARRTRTESAFGARFDMESDAGFILALSVLVWQSGQAPAWVILIGALRYLFVAAGWVMPALRGQLFPSMRRKVVCVVQGVSLLVALGPIIPGRLATTVVGMALASLVWSFAVDSAWLLGQGPAVAPKSARPPSARRGRVRDANRDAAAA